MICRTADIKKALGELLQELTVAVEPLLHGFMTLIDEGMTYQTMSTTIPY